MVVSPMLRHSLVQLKILTIRFAFYETSPRHVGTNPVGVGKFGKELITHMVERIQNYNIYNTFFLIHHWQVQTYIL